MAAIFTLQHLLPSLWFWGWIWGSYHNAPSLTISYLKMHFSETEARKTHKPFSIFGWTSGQSLKTKAWGKGSKTRRKYKKKRILWNSAPSWLLEHSAERIYYCSDRLDHCFSWGSFTFNFNLNCQDYRQKKDGNARVLGFSSSISWHIKSYV